MSLDERHLQLRRRLDKLGFNQPLPIGALGLVTALLDDLLQVNSILTGFFLNIKFSFIIFLDYRKFKRGKR